MKARITHEKITIQIFPVFDDSHASCNISFYRAFIKDVRFGKIIMRQSRGIIGKRLQALLLLSLASTFLLFGCGKKEEVDEQPAVSQVIEKQPELEETNETERGLRTDEQNNSDRLQRTVGNCYK